MPTFIIKDFQSLSFFNVHLPHTDTHQNEAESCSWCTALATLGGIKQQHQQYNDRNNLSLQTLINSEGDGLTPQSKKECLEAVNNGFVYDSPYIQDIKIPFFNLIYFVLFLINMVYLIRKKHLFH